MKIPDKPFRDTGRSTYTPIILCKAKGPCSRQEILVLGLKREMVRQNKITYEEAKGSTGNILKLLYGRVDCIMIEDKAFDYEYKKIKIEEKIVTEKALGIKKGAIIGKDPVYIGYSKTAMGMGKYPFHLEFMQSFDSEIYKMTKSGEIFRIMDAYKD